MKIVGIIAIVISIIGIGSGLYCQLEYVPKTNQSDLYGPELYMVYMDAKFFWGSVALFAGIPGFLLGLIAGIKKANIGWLAAILGIGSVIFGLLQSTHMFS